ncbi:MAG: phosphotransferase [Thermomicrobiales bacterium]|nr:phosphotransferase [Thermomicrobiales bacterium]
MAELAPWHIHITAALVHPAEPAVWVPDAAGPALRFELDSPVWFPDVAPVLQAVQERWRLDAVVLRCLAWQSDPDARQQWISYLLQPRPAVLPHHGRWLPIRDLAPADLPDDPHREILETALRELDAPPPLARRPWAERGWFAEAETWAATALHAAGAPPSRPPAQRRTWGLSTVWRYETPAGAYYFKAAAHRDTSGTAATADRSFLFANEASLLAGLAERFPGHVSNPVVTDPQRGWMLLPDAGPALATSDDLGAWEAALRAHARHQRAYAGKTDELLRIGCLDRRLSRLAAQLDDLATDDAALACLDPASRNRLHAAIPALRALLDEAANLDLPDTLVHGDFHAGNIGLRDGRAVYFDWTDACVAPPFLDLVTFLDESDVLDAAPGSRERLRAAYLAEWQGVATAEALARSAALAEPIGMVHQAISYQHMLPGLEDPTRSAMGAGVTYWVGRLLDWLA